MADPVPRSGTHPRLTLLGSPPVITSLESRRDDGEESALSSDLSVEVKRNAVRSGRTGTRWQDLSLSPLIRSHFPCARSFPVSMRFRVIMNAVGLVARLLSRRVLNQSVNQAHSVEYRSEMVTPEDWVYETSGHRLVFRERLGSR